MPALYHPHHRINHPGKPQDQQVSDQCQDLQPGGAVQPRSERKLQRSTKGGNHLDAGTGFSVRPPRSAGGPGRGEVLPKVPIPRLLSKPPEPESPTVARGTCL